MKDMILDGPSSSIETSDRLSQLPEHLILRIIFFLPAKDAARSSILSKAWLSRWDSLPAFSFSSDALARKENLLKHDASFDTVADEYMDLIEKSLEKLRHHKVRIKRFQLDLFKNPERHVSRFNQFMELANRNQVEELVLRGLVSDLNRKRPSVPLAAFALTNSFRVLGLKACALASKLLESEHRFPCLQKLSLYRVKSSKMDQMIQNLLANCPLLEKFYLEGCKVENVKLVDHPKLNKVRIVGVPVIWIEAKSIKNFRCDYTGDKPFELHLVSCENLEVLDLHFRFTGEYIQEMVAKLPHIRSLILRPCIIMDRLKISSPSLQFLLLYGANEIEIDAPNLQRYHYFAGTGAATTPVFIDSERLQLAALFKYLTPANLASHWFIHLKDCLSSFEYNVLRIYVCSECDMKTNKVPILENLRQISAAPPVNLEFISIIAFHRPFDFSAFFDCCFWICRPKTILIKTSCETNTDLDDQLQLDKLVPWEENPTCCRNSERKCWQHYLDGVKIGETIKTKDEFSINLYVKHCRANGIALASSPKSSEVELIALHLNWKMTGQKRNHRWECSQKLFQEHGFSLNI